ncbi:GNAT family N-acetyltransferase [Gorillibacterium sp. sgz500922]|uniref:GNAT family N-acetyltransferase n=1 Tax=Gorillibacterium sp. sgz500922 TaxID=3446694 RepID=UPI003F66FD5D
MSITDKFESERLRYRPFQPEDLEPYVSMCNEATRRRWFYFQEPACLTAEFWAKEIEHGREVWSRKINLLKDECSLAVVRKDTGEFIGLVSLSKFHGPEEELENVEIGYHIGEAYQSKGYGTEAARAAVEWGLAQLREIGAEPKIAGRAEHENWPSRRVMEKAGFVFSRGETYVSLYEFVDGTED